MDITQQITEALLIVQDVLDNAAQRASSPEQHLQLLADAFEMAGQKLRPVAAPVHNAEALASLESFAEHFEGPPNKRADTTILAQLMALSKFKQYVHRRLDEAGVDRHEEQNALNGCRIGARLDDVLAQPAALEAAAAKALGALENCYEVTDWPATGKTEQDEAIAALRAALSRKGGNRA